MNTFVPIIESIESILESPAFKIKYIEPAFPRDEDHRGTVITNNVGEESGAKVIFSISLTKFYVSFQTHNLLTLKDPKYIDLIMMENMFVIQGAYFVSHKKDGLYTINYQSAVHYEHMNDDIFAYQFDMLTDQCDRLLKHVIDEKWELAKPLYQPGYVITGQDLEPIRLSGRTTMSR